MPALQSRRRSQEASQDSGSVSCSDLAVEPPSASAKQGMNADRFPALAFVAPAEPVRAKPRASNQDDWEPVISCRRGQQDHIVTFLKIREPSSSICDKQPRSSFSKKIEQRRGMWDDSHDGSGCGSNPQNFREP